MILTSLLLSKDERDIREAKSSQLREIVTSSCMLGLRVSTASEEKLVQLKERSLEEQIMSCLGEDDYEMYVYPGHRDSELCLHSAWRYSIW